MSTLVECKSLVKKYGGKAALAGIDLTIESGKIIGLLGPNGSGKTTLIKLMNGLLTPTSGTIKIENIVPGPATKKIVSYLPDNSYLNNAMTIQETIHFFEDFYDDFNSNRAYEMLTKLNISPKDKLKSLSKGTKEKVQLILVMSRDAELYVLDEPIAGVDPASRDYILNTIITNYNENASIIISTHLISDIENILDEVIFIHNGCVELVSSVDKIREEKGMSIDALFREVFKC